VDKGNDYVIQVKSNQKKLCAGLKLSIELSKAIDVHETEEKNKGRIEKRTVKVFKAERKYIDASWKKLNRIIQVTSEGIRKKKAYHEIRYYISSLEENSAKVFAIGIRQHWSIENQLHRVKDVVQNEDNCLIRNKQIVANLSLIKSITISIYRINGHSSIKKAVEKFRNQLRECSELIGIFPILKN